MIGIGFSNILFPYHVVTIWNLYQIYCLIEEEKIVGTMSAHINEVFETTEIVSVARVQNENLDPPSYADLYPNSIENPPNYDSVCHF